MLVHPPMLLMGYMSWSLPFAFAIAALITGQLDARWLRSIRRWTLAAWSIQTLVCCWAHGGRITCWAGAATGAGIPSKTRRCCPG